MAPKGKLFEKVKMWELAVTSGCHYSVNLTASAPKAVQKAVREAMFIARDVGPTYINLYTPCILEIGLDAHEGLREMKEQDKDRFVSFKYISEAGQAHLDKLKAEGIK
jgi:pyruvate ferredoxin oxidoreductase beta subunit